MATRLDLLTRSLRRIGVCGQGEEPDADMEQDAGAIADSLFAEIGADVSLSWDLDTIPEASFVPLSLLLACDLAGDYSLPAPMPRGTAWNRFMATVRSDDRPDSRDLDEDGTVSEAEANAGKRAAYY